MSSSRGPRDVEPLHRVTRVLRCFVVTRDPGNPRATGCPGWRTARRAGEAARRSSQASDRAFRTQGTERTVTIRRASCEYAGLVLRPMGSVSRARGEKRRA
jgi:hypothetical protein